MLKLPIYLDNSATTPCDPGVVEAMLPYFTDSFGNAASRSHPFGWIASEAVDVARERVAALVGAEPAEIVFTSGATEGVNLAIKGVFEMYAVKGNHIIIANTEHKAVIDTCHHLEKAGAVVATIPVAGDGLIDVAAIEAAILPTTILVAVMYANNETGTIQPIRAISEVARRHQVLFFCDAAQAVGKIPVNVAEDGIDIMTLSAHKMYGPKGVGALYVRRRNPRVRLVAQMDGGGHERGLRSGTLNVPAIVGFGKACEIAATEMATEGRRLGALRDKLEAGLLRIPETKINGSTMYRLPHVTNIAFQYVEGEGLMMGTNKNIAVSSGSACTSASLEPSYVLKALGLDDDLAYASLRFGLGRFTTEEEIDFTIKEMTAAVTNLRAMSPLWELSRTPA